ncbi:hypothetical protein, partial [Neisseria cinerea]|uniref:hypothetical protein n=1 Tax=Neisseria cinerea TaxID=483 RepID=UPI003C7D3DBC
LNVFQTAFCLMKMFRRQLCLHVVIWRYFCPVLSDFIAVTVMEGGTGGFIVNKAAVMGGLEQYRYP